MKTTSGWLALVFFSSLSAALSQPLRTRPTPTTAPAVFVLGSETDNGNGVIRVLDPRLNVIRDIKLGGINSFAKLVPPGIHIAAVTQFISSGGSIDTRLLSIDTQTRSVTDLGTLQDVPPIIGDGSHLLLINEELP